MCSHKIPYSYCILHCQLVRKTRRIPENILNDFATRNAVSAGLSAKKKIYKINVPITAVTNKFFDYGHFKRACSVVVSIAILSHYTIRKRLSRKKNNFSFNTTSNAPAMCSINYCISFFF